MRNATKPISTVADHYDFRKARSNEDCRANRDKAIKPVSTIAQLKPVSRAQLEFALSCLNEEFEKLLSLASCLRQQVEPADQQQPEDGVDVVAWRLAQMLEERLESTDFSAAMRSLVLGEV